MKLSKEYDFKLAKEAGLALDRWPESEEEAKRAEEFLAKELANLSLDEHERALFDIHGITPVEEECPEMIGRSLQDLQTEIDRIESKEAYDLARQMNPEYVINPSFRLQFLRCEQFDIKAAAKLIIEHFESKRMGFGSGEILARDILQSDLNETERQMLQSGYLQVLPVRDASGRALIFLTSGPVNQFPEGYDGINESRVMWYQTMAMLRDEETQRRGLVYLLMNFTSYRVTVENFTCVTKIGMSMPANIVGGHYCYNDPDLTPFIRGFQIMVSEHDRCRLRVHFGNREDIDFTLQTYGIPTEACPLKRDGSLALENHHAWLAMLRAQEERVGALDNVHSLTVHDADQQALSGEEAFIGIPGRFDVLFGKSVLARDHTGTRRALHVVEMYYEDYERTDGKFQKTDIAEKVISVIHESGGRFLKQREDGSWMEAPEVESKRKIAHWFRHSRSKKKPLNKQDSSSSCISGGLPENTDLTPSETPLTGHSKRAVTPIISSPVDITLLDDQLHHKHKKSVRP